MNDLCQSIAWDPNNLLLWCRGLYRHEHAHRDRGYVWTDPMPYDTPENTRWEAS